MWAREKEFEPVLTSAAVRFGVPAWVVMATAAKESSFDPRAFTGSRGLMQLEILTARDRGYTGPVGDDTTRTGGLYDPAVSAEFGTRHLAWLRRRYPDQPWDAIYAAYNTGAIHVDQSGRFTNSKGDPKVQKHVVQWRAAADYFRPGWRATDPGG